MLTDGPDPTTIQFSLFTTPVSRGPHRAETWTLADLHNAIRAGHWWDVIAPVRELAPHKQEKDESGKRKSARSRSSTATSRTKPCPTLFSPAPGTRATATPTASTAKPRNARATACCNPPACACWTWTISTTERQHGSSPPSTTVPCPGQRPHGHPPAATESTSWHGSTQHRPTKPPATPPTPPWPAISPSTCPASRSPTTPAPRT